MARRGVRRKARLRARPARTLEAALWLLYMTMEPKRPDAAPAMAKQAQNAARPLIESGGTEAIDGAEAASAVAFDMAELSECDMAGQAERGEGAGVGAVAALATAGTRRKGGVNPLDSFLDSGVRDRERARDCKTLRGRCYYALV